MTTQQPSTDWEDGLDLRRWIEPLFRRWWLIAGITVASVIVAAIYTFVFQESVYQSSGGATLPPGSSENGIGLTPLGYQEFASSTAVLESVNESLKLKSSAAQLRNNYGFQVNESNFITVNTTANSAELAFRLASTWIEVYGQHLQDRLREQATQRQTGLAETAELLNAELTSVNADLEDLNLENPLGSLDTELAALESELFESRKRLRELKVNLTPSSEARLASLRQQSGSQDGTIGGGGTPGSTESTAGAGLGALVPINEANSDPAYFELTQNLLKSQLVSLEQDLVNSELRLRQLTLTNIPNLVSAVAALERAQKSEPKVLLEDSTGISLRVTPTPNPAYIELTRTLEETALELETQQGEVNILENKIAVLQREINDIRAELVSHQALVQKLRQQSATRQEIKQIESELSNHTEEIRRLEEAIPALETQVIQMRRDVQSSNTARQDLENETARLSQDYNTVKSQLNSLSAIESRLTFLSSLSTIREPALPNKPVAPNRTRDILLATLLGLMVGVAAALAWDFYHAQASSRHS